MACNVGHMMCVGGGGLMENICFTDTHSMSNGTLKHAVIETMPLIPQFANATIATLLQLQHVLPLLPLSLLRSYPHDVCVLHAAESCLHP